MDLLSLFQWKTREAVKTACGEANRKHLQRLAGTLNGLLATPEGGDADGPELNLARLRSRLQQLPDREYLRVLRAPETSYQLSRVAADGPLPFKRYLRASLDVEQWRLDPGMRLTENTWSALGELYLPAGTEPGALPAEEGAETWSAQRAYRATQLHGQLVLDFFSPRATRDLEKNSFRPKPYGSAEPFTLEEHRQVRAKIQDAVDGLREVSPAAHDFVFQTVRVQIPRKQTHPDFYPTSFKGSSSRVYIGRSNIYNVQLDYIDPTHVAQSILHEAIHNHLYKVENEQRLIPDVQLADQSRLLSPWTGNRINLWAFVHGTIVFYALFYFFRLPLAARCFADKSIRYYVEQSVRGFSERRMSQALEPYRQSIQPLVYEQLEAMESDVMKAA